MSEWKQQFKGQIWTIDQQVKPDGRVFELARRTPGVRIMVVDKEEGRLLLNRESRHELGGDYDLRLPGGKVFDNIDDWLLADPDGKADLLAQATTTAVAEAHEECGIIIDPSDLNFIKKDINGGKGEWDLYYFMATKFTVDPNGPSYHGTEAAEIDGWDWHSKAEALEKALDLTNSGMSESRSARYVGAWALDKLT